MPNRRIIALAAVLAATAAGPALAGPEPAFQLKHEQPVTALVFSRDGNTLAAANGNRIHLWDTRTRKAVGVLAPDKGEARVASVAISPDARRIASGHGDRLIRLWDANTGKLLRELAGSGEYVTNVGFSPDGKLLASGGPEPAVRLWDANTGKEVRSFARASSWHIGSVLFSRDGKMLIAGGYDGSIRQWAIDTGKELASLPAPQFTHLALSPNGRMFALAGQGNTVALLELATGKVRSQFGRHGGADVSLDFSADGRWLAGRGKQEKHVYIWNVVEGKEALQLDGDGPFAFSSCGRYLAVARGGTVCVWDQAKLLKDYAATPVKLNQDELTELWGELASDDADKAWLAITKLAMAQAEAFVRDRLKAEGKPAGKTVDVPKAIADLDADSYKVRERATNELIALGRSAEAQLRAALEAKPSQEARARIELILEKFAGRNVAPGQLQLLRAGEALELMARPGK